MEQQIGTYKIESELGRGGMGIVYLATDSRLDRQVAIKALPDHFADDPDRLARFEREAKSLAALNHPNVAGIHGIEEHDGRKYLILEYVEGETLADRLDRGAIALDETLEFCVQIAAGLEAAHEAGVIHRDLKPANVRITPDGKAKVLDFGLARIEETSTTGSSVSQMPTLTTPHSPTTPGAILGTAPYMSPEQARGRRVDKRSDIWSFGVVLYECLTGMSPFIGETATDSIGAILHKDVDVGLLPAQTPRAVRRVIARCLERDRNQRLRDIGDARIELERAQTPGSVDESLASAPRGLNIGLSAAVAVFFAAIGAVGAIALRSNPHESRPVIYASINPAPDTTIVHLGDLAGPAVVSPDGASVAYVARDSKGQRRIWVRSLTHDETIELSRSLAASHPFWSPDSKSIGYFSQGELKRIDVATRSVRTICEARAGRGGAWLDDGTILFAPRFQSPIYRVSANGGEAVAVTEIDAERHSSHRWPFPLPNGKFLFVGVNHNPGMLDESALFLGSLDGSQPVEVMRSYFGAEVIGDQLLFVRDGTLHATEFDIHSGQMLGDAKPIVERVVTDLSTWRVNFSASDAGVLVYHRFSDVDANQLEVVANADRVQSYSRDGRRTTTIAAGVAQTNVSLSPDGRSLAIGAAVGGSADFDIWIYPVPTAETDLDSDWGVPTRLTFMDGSEVDPVWSPDGQEIIFTRLYGPGQLGIYRKRIGGGREELVLARPHGNDDDEMLGATLSNNQLDIWSVDWTNDGRFLLYGKGRWQGGSPETAIYCMPLDGGETIPITTSDSEIISYGEVSPDVRWFAYTSSSALGDPEVYVEPFFPGWEGVEGEIPAVGARWRISLAGGQVPRWSDDGSELYYVTTEGTMIAVSVQTDGASFVHDTGAPLFQVAFEDGIDFDVEPRGESGDRFFINGITQTGDSSVNLILNWQELLKD